MSLTLPKDKGDSDYEKSKSPIPAMKDMKQMLTTFTRKVTKEVIKEKDAKENNTLSANNGGGNKGSDLIKRAPSDLDSARQTPIDGTPPSTSNATQAKPSIPQQQLSAILLGSLHKPDSIPVSYLSTNPPTTQPPPVPSKRKSDKQLQHSLYSIAESDTANDHVELIPLNTNLNDTTRAEALAGKSEREIIMIEFLESEEGYIRKLKMIFDYWQTPMEDSLSTKKPLASKEQINELFSALHPVYLLHTTVILTLLKQEANGDNFGKKFLEVIDMFKLYVHFVNHYESYLKIYEEILRKKKYRNFERETAPKAGVSTLVDILITPVQRLPRYQLFLERLVKATPPEYPDREKLKEALEKMVKQNNIINERKSDYESRTKLLHVQKAIGNSFNIITPNRRWIYDGILSYNHISRGWIRVHFYLMNDIILLTEPTEKREQCLRKWSGIRTLISEEISALEFQINLPGGIPAVFQTTTEQERNEMLKRIRDAIEYAPETENDANYNTHNTIDEDQHNTSLKDDESEDDDPPLSTSSSTSSSSSSLPPTQSPPLPPISSSQPAIPSSGYPSSSLLSSLPPLPTSLPYSSLPNSSQTVRPNSDRSRTLSYGGPNDSVQTQPPSSAPPHVPSSAPPSSVPPSVPTFVPSSVPPSVPTFVPSSLPPLAQPPSHLSQHQIQPKLSVLIQPPMSPTPILPSPISPFSTPKPRQFPPAVAARPRILSVQLSPINPDNFVQPDNLMTATMPSGTTQQEDSSSGLLPPPTRSRASSTPSTSYVGTNSPSNSPFSTSISNSSPSIPSASNSAYSSPSTPSSTTPASPTINSTPQLSPAPSSSISPQNPATPGNSTTASVRTLPRLSTPKISGGRPLPAPPPRSESTEEIKLREKVKELEDKVAILKSKLKENNIPWDDPDQDGKYVVKALITIDDKNFSETFSVATVDEMVLFIKNKYINCNNNSNSNNNNNNNGNNNNNNNNDNHDTTNNGANDNSHDNEKYLLEYFDSEFKEFVVVQKLIELPSSLHLRFRKI